jgi:hypothetical protein
MRRDACNSFACKPSRVQRANRADRFTRRTTPIVEADIMSRITKLLAVTLLLIAPAARAWAAVSPVSTCKETVVVRTTDGPAVGVLVGTESRWTCWMTGGYTFQCVTWELGWYAMPDGSLLRIDCL